jgi:hypothetical protein
MVNKFGIPFTIKLRLQDPSGGAKLLSHLSKPPVGLLDLLIKLLQV